METGVDPFDGKVHALMAEDLLLLLLHVVTELPRPPGREHRDAELRRELVHRLACQECSHSEVSVKRQYMEMGGWSI